MNSIQCIEKLYKIIDSKLGKKAAKEAVDAMVYNVISDLEEKGLEVSERNLSEKFSQHVKDFEEAAKSEVA